MIKIGECNICNEKYEWVYGTKKYCNECSKKVGRKRNWFVYHFGKENVNMDEVVNSIKEDRDINITDIDGRDYSYIKSIISGGSINEIDFYKILDIYCKYFVINLKSENRNINELLKRLEDKMSKKDKKIIKVG